MDVAGLVGVLAQLGVAAAAFRLASRLVVRVEDHEKRIVRLESAKVS